MPTRRSWKQVLSDKSCFLPKNTTATTCRLQPLDLGILQAFKLEYYKLLLTQMVCKVDKCSSASEVCNSVDILQAKRWSAMTWNDVLQSTVVKCFIKAGILNSERKKNAVEAAGGDVDPFTELDIDISMVESWRKNQA